MKVVGGMVIYIYIYIYIILIKKIIKKIGLEIFAILSFLANFSNLH
jgi:hypothetical protein